MAVILRDLLADKGLAGALCHAVNRWLVEYCAADRKRLKGVGLIPCQDPPTAAKELEFIAQQDGAEGNGEAEGWTLACRRKA